MPRFHTLGEFIALDFETTGLSTETETVIEIGAIHFINGREIARFATLVNPRRPLAPEISQLTGITNADLETAPVLSEIRDEFAVFIADKPIMAHNTEFERAFLKHIFGNKYEPVLMMDTKDILALIFPLAPTLSLEYFIRFFGVRDFEHHRGLQDALDMVTIVQHLDAELDKPECADLCAIVDYWFHNVELGWGWRPFFSERHNAALPDYRNFKTMFSGEERTELDEQLATAPTKLKEQQFFERAYEHYQLRAAQQQMAEKAARTLIDGGVYVVEAGTGTGKTLAYLTAALSALATDASSPVVISTHTKVLQNQFLDHELPRLRALFDLPELHAVSLKGMSNYACLKKLSGLLPENERLFPDDTKALYAGAFLLAWINATKEGETEELPRPLYEFPIIQQAATTAFADYRDCTRNECEFFQQCFYFKKQWEAQSAHILAVNHSLLLTYPRSYPEFDRLIVDEADELSSEAIDAFSGIASYSQILDTVRALTDQNGIASHAHQTANILQRDTRNAQKTITLPNVSYLWQAGQRANEILVRLSNVMAAVKSDDVFTLQATLTDARFSHDQRTMLLSELENLRVVVSEIIIHAEKLLRAISELEGNEPSSVTRELSFRIEDVEKIHKVIVEFIEQDTNLAALYVRIERNNWSIVATPYNIGEIFATTMGEKLYAGVFTSATISSTRDMQDFIRGLGLNLLQEGERAKPLYTSRFKSPFNYRDNSKIVFLKGFPANNQPQFAERAAEFIAHAASRLRGRTLVLFTSKARQQQVHTALMPRLQKMGIELISHGITSPSQIKCIDQFKSADAAVLMGARGLWKGVDIPGDDLQCLVLEKMPYAIPNPFTKGLQEALVAQYAEVAHSNGETPDEKRLAMIAWNEVDKPLMFQAFRQMFGRLIRTEQDRGVMFVLDSQLQSGGLSSRHKQLLELLPGVPYTLAFTDNALDEADFLSSD